MMADDIVDEDRMTIKDLIEILEKQDPDLPVIINIKTTADSTDTEHEAGETINDAYSISGVEEMEEEGGGTILAIFIDSTTGDDSLEDGEDDDEPTDSDEEESTDS